MEFRHIMYVLGITRVETGLNKRANGESVNRRTDNTMAKRKRTNW